MSGVCVLNNNQGEARGLVQMTPEASGGVRFRVKLWKMPPGKHGFHVHRSGDISQGSHSLCDHFTSPDRTHGDLNDPRAHNGDLGNLEVGEDGACDASFTATQITLNGDVANTIVGRSLVVHALE